MLDVHPPEHTPHSWRDFFIHIATIVIGLLIAVGLEQTVEWVHRRHEIKETREALLQEREENRRAFPASTADFRLECALLENNLDVLLFLQQHPGTPEEELPGTLQWDLRYVPGTESVWKNAQQTQVLSLLPRHEAEEDADFYRLLEQIDDATQALIPAAISATRYAIVDPNPAHMTPAQVSEEIESTEKAMGLARVWGIRLSNLHGEFADFGPAPTMKEVFSFVARPRSPADQKKLAAVEALTNAKLAPVRAAHEAADKLADSSQ